MDNGRITGGSVSYLRRVNRGNYEHDEASAKLDFVVHEDGSAADVLTTVEAEAKISVFGQLGLPAPGAPARPLAQTPAQETPAPSKKPKAAASAAKQEPSKPAADASDADPLAQAAATAPASSSATEAASASAAEDPLAGAGDADTTSSTASTAADMPAEEDFSTSQREVTDAELGQAASLKNGELSKTHKEGGAAMIRALIGKFVPPGEKLINIPQGQRQAFLDQLQALS